MWMSQLIYPYIPYKWLCPIVQQLDPGTN